jgi:hypothetical protein
LRGWCLAELHEDNFYSLQVPVRTFLKMSGYPKIAELDLKSKREWKGANKVRTRNTATKETPGLVYTRKD